MPSQTTRRAQSPDFAGDSVGDELDPELISLPDPPRRERRMTLLVLAVTALASLAMIGALARDAAYAFRSAAPSELGDLKSARVGGLWSGEFVHAHGMLGAAGAIRYERPFVFDSFRVAPVAGRPDVYVDFRVPAGEESARYVPPTEFRGRLVRFDAAGLRHRGLRGAIAERTGTPVPAGAWLLVDGEAPDHARWAVALVVVFAVFALWNLVALARLVRRVK